MNSRITLCSVLLIFLFPTFSFGVEDNSPGLEPSNAASEAFRPRGKAFFTAKNHNFGSVKRGEKLSATFSFKNVGAGPLVIQGVHAACGCTASQVDTAKHYAPGESGQMSVVFDTSNFEGPVQKTVSVVTNEGDGATALLSIAADVHSEISSDPPLVDFGEVPSKNGAQKFVNLKLEKGVELDVSGIRYNKDLIQVEVSHPRNEKGIVQLSVVLKKQLNTGFLKDSIVVPNTSTAMKEFKIPVRATVIGAVQLSHNYIEFGAMQKGESVERRIKIKTGSETKLVGNKFELIVNHEKIPQADRYVSVDMRSPDSNSLEKDRYLALKLNHSGLASGSVHGKVILETNDPQQKELSVDIYAFFK